MDDVTRLFCDQVRSAFRYGEQALREAAGHAAAVREAAAREARREGSVNVAAATTVGGEGHTTTVHSDGQVTVVTHDGRTQVIRHRQDDPGR